MTKYFYVAALLFVAVLAGCTDSDPGKSIEKSNTRYEKPASSNQLIKGYAVECELDYDDKQWGFYRKEFGGENLRMMLLAMVDDVRVVLIKLAERLELMRSLKEVSSEVCKFIAHETLEIFSPLANRLGIWQDKWEV